MFTRKTVVELSDESRAALDGVNGDVRRIHDEMLAIRDLMTELASAFEKTISTFDALVSLIKQEVIVGAGSENVIGVETVADEQEIPLRKDRPKQALPDSMAERGEFNSDDRADRIRATPWNRAPRNVQVEWIMQVLGDGEWHNPVTIGRDYANDERHYRYLRGAVSGRLREMHEEGLVERRDSQAKGAMFEYRVKRVLS